MKRSILTAAAVTLLAVGTSACGGDKATGPGGSIAGTYNLQTVNGAAPPVILLQIGAYKLEVTAANLVVNSNNTFSSSSTYRETDAGTTTTSTSVCAGTYTRNGNSLTFTEPETSNEDCGGTYTGTWSNGNTLTVALDAEVQAVFRK